MSDNILVLRPDSLPGYVFLLGGMQQGLSGKGELRSAFSWAFWEPGVCLAYRAPVSKNSLNIGRKPALKLPKAGRLLWLILWTSKATQCFRDAWAAKWPQYRCRGQGSSSLIEPPSWRTAGTMYHTVKYTDLVIQQSHFGNLFWEMEPTCQDAHTWMLLRVLFKAGKTGNCLKVQERSVYTGRVCYLTIYNIVIQ